MRKAVKIQVRYELSYCIHTGAPLAGVVRQNLGPFRVVSVRMRNMSQVYPWSNPIYLQKCTQTPVSLNTVEINNSRQFCCRDIPKPATPVSSRPSSPVLLLPPKVILNCFCRFFAFSTQCLHPNILAPNHQGNP